jgi:hypothetical protein
MHSEGQISIWFFIGLLLLAAAPIDNTRAH